MKDSSNLIPNTTFGALKQKFLYLDREFPEDDENFKCSNAKVLFVNEYKTKKGELKYGHFINPNGDEIFIVDRNNINQLINYFTVLKLIKSSKILNKIEGINNELQECIKAVKKEIPAIKTTEDLFVYYINNKSKFSNIMFNNPEPTNVRAYLNEICGNILDLPSRKIYNNVTINNISNNLVWNKKITIGSISIEQFFKYLDSTTIKQLQDIIGNDYIEKFKSGEINPDKLKILFGKDGKPLQLLTEYILSKDLSFTMAYNKVEKDRIYFKRIFPTLESQFNIGFEELQKYKEPVYYNGKYILEADNYFYVTNYYTTESQFTKRFSSLEDAKDYIDNNEDQPILKNSFIDFHKKDYDADGNILTDDSAGTIIQTKDNTIAKGTLITLLDYDVPNIPIDQISKYDRPFLSKNFQYEDEDHPVATMNDFYDYIENVLGFNSKINFKDYNFIKQNINTPEKVVLFITQLNNPSYKQGFNRENAADIKQLAREIGKLDKNNKRYYLIDKSSKSQVQVIRISNDSKADYRADYKAPVMQLWQAASKVLGQKLGFKLQILTEPEEGKENAKAYIKEDTIYINLQKASSTDLLHEYAHIFLGYLKNTNRDTYLQLINLVWKLGKKDATKYYISANYADSSLEDKMEEYFVEKFGQFILGKTDGTFDDVFNGELVSNSTNIFTQKDITVKELYGSTIEEVFTQLSSDIGTFLRNKKTLMDGEYKELFKTTRQKSEWVRQQIHDKKLIEYDCKM